MKTKIRFLLVGTLLPLSAFCATETTSYSSGSPLIYDAAAITTEGTVQITGTADVSYVSDTKVTLTVGFKVAVGAKFRAVAGPDVDGDGMSNAWEVTNNFNLLVADGTSDKDDDGISNLSEYQLGTDPDGGTTNDDDDSAAPLGLKIQKPN